MSDRRNKAASMNKIVAYTAAIVIHVLIIGAMVFNFTSKPKEIEAYDADKIDVVKATTIDEDQIRQQQDRIKQKDKDKKRQEELEKKRLANLKKQAEEEKKRIADLKETQKQEQEKALELEEQRKEIALKKKQEKEQLEKEKEQRRKAEAKRKKEEAEKKRREAQEKKRKAEAEKKRKEAEAAAELKKKQERAEKLERDEAQKSFITQLAAEEAKQRTTTLTAKHSALVRDAINAKRTIAPDFDSWLVAELKIKLSPSGDVENVSVVKSSGNDRYDRDAEKAVLNASPLPIPTAEQDEAAHKVFRNMILTVRMPGA